MSRASLGFLVFCLVLIVASAGVVWYVGPTLAGIVFDASRREEPYYLLHLLPSDAVGSGEGSPSLRTRFLNMAAEDDGQLLWRGGDSEVFEGPVLFEVAAAELLVFASGGDLVQLLTSSAYRELLRGHERDGPRLLGTPEAPAPLAMDRASILVLYHNDPDRVGSSLGVPGESGWLALLPDYGGALLWRAPVEPIRSADQWNRALLLQFADVAAAEAWLRDPRTVTERSIAGTEVENMVILLIQPAGFALR